LNTIRQLERWWEKRYCKSCSLSIILWIRTAIPLMTALLWKVSIFFWVRFKSSCVQHTSFTS